MIIKTIDDRRKLYIFDAVRQLVDHTVAHFIHEAEAAIGARGQFCVALSGGQTPKVFLEALMQSDRAKQLDWNKIHLFWSDERAVSPDHADSNFGMAAQFFTSPPLSQVHMHRMPAERDDRDQAASVYQQEIKTVCPDAIFDIVYLGLGDDGHTASLFPGNSAITVENKLVVSTYVESKKSWRMTFTLPLINQAKTIIILVSGSAKAAMLHKILFEKNTPPYPAELVGTQTNKALFFSDQTASSLCMS